MADYTDKLGRFTYAEVNRDILATLGRPGPIYSALLLLCFVLVAIGGVGMSGILSEPRKAIPRGTMIVIFVGMVVYFMILVFLAFKVDIVTLRMDMLIM